METGNLYFVGRNYVEHAKELNNEVPTKPLIFTKPISVISKDGKLPYPKHSKEVHFEGEMVFKYNKGGKFLVSCGIDYTARDIQADIKKKGWPWFEAKCFQGSAVIGNIFVEVSKDDLAKLEIETYLNGELRQKGNYGQKIFKVDFLFEYLSSLVPLYDGDLLFTGTPAGVGKVSPGDKLRVVLKLNGNIVSEVVSEVI